MCALEFGGIRLELGCSGYLTVHRRVNLGFGNGLEGDYA